MQRPASLLFRSGQILQARARDYSQLLKPNLSFMVVFSSVAGYLLAPGVSFVWMDVLVLFLGGTLVTGGANTLNQVLERDIDALMNRTRNRPLPDGRMSVAEALTLGLGCAAAGAVLMAVHFNPLTGGLSVLSLVLYAFAYTPMKRVHRVSVLIGALPGAMPPLIGWAAATGGIGLGGWVLFLVQFFWQFPHYWAIAWVLNDDYARAGLRMLPSKGGRTRFTGMQCAIYALALFPLAIVPRLMGMVGDWGMFAALLAAVYYLNASANFWRENDHKTAKKVMYASFLYLPVVLLAFLFDKV